MLLILGIYQQLQPVIPFVKYMNNICGCPSLRTAACLSDFLCSPNRSPAISSLLSLSTPAYIPSCTGDLLHLSLSILSITSSLLISNPYNLSQCAPEYKLTVSQCWHKTLIENSTHFCHRQLIFLSVLMSPILSAVLIPYIWKKNLFALSSPPLGTLISQFLL